MRPISEGQEVKEEKEEKEEQQEMNQIRVKDEEETTEKNCHKSGNNETAWRKSERARLLHHSGEVSRRIAGIRQLARRCCCCRFTLTAQSYYTASR